MKTIIEDNEVMDHFPSDGIKIQYVFITISNSSYNKVFQRNDLYYGIPFFFLTLTVSIILTATYNDKL